MKRGVFLLGVIVVGVLVTAALLQTPTKTSAQQSSSGRHALPPASASPSPLSTPDPELVIDGSRNPELIPDHVAYSLLFRFLSGRVAEEEKHRARSYLKMVFACEGCDPATQSARVNALMDVAAEFERGVVVLDARAAEEKRRLPPSAAKLALAALQKEKEALVLRAVASLPGRLGVEGAELVRDFMNGHFKRRVKLHKSQPVHTTVDGAAE